MVKHAICGKAWIYNKTRFYDKAKIWDKERLVIQMTYDSDIAVIVIAISHKGNGSGNKTEGVPTLVTAISDCDIASEGVQSDQRRVFEIAGEFM